jgi:ubiquinone/menaquinone biosynthesis C-methylase UbiE
MEADRHAMFLMSDERREWQNPVEIAKRIGIKDGMLVADLGCGPGFFTIPIASMVGRRGAVYAVDSDETMLRHLRSNLKELGTKRKRVKIFPADISATGIPSSSVDVALFANLLHDLEDKTSFLKEVRRICKPEALVVDVDWRKVRSEMGAPSNIRLSKAESTRLLSENGFRVTRSFFAGPHHYGIVCKATG